MYTEYPWELDIDNIFHHIDIFIERCQDMIVICKAMIDFARCRIILIERNMEYSDTFKTVYLNV